MLNAALEQNGTFLADSDTGALTVNVAELHSVWVCHCLVVEGPLL